MKFMRMAGYPRVRIELAKTSPTSGPFATWPGEKGGVVDEVDQPRAPSTAPIAFARMTRFPTPKTLYAEPSPPQFLSPPYRLAALNGPQWSVFANDGDTLLSAQSYGWGGGNIATWRARGSKDLFHWNETSVALDRRIFENDWCFPQRGRRCENTSGVKTGGERHDRCSIHEEARGAESASSSANGLGPQVD